MYYGYFDPFSLIFHILGWIIIIALIVWLVRGSRSNRHDRHMRMREMWGPHHHDKALDLLKERYAKGDITKEEYEEKKNTLSE
jgi:putative membrane protein